MTGNSGGLEVGEEENDEEYDDFYDEYAIGVEDGYLRAIVHLQKLMEGDDSAIRSTEFGRSFLKSFNIPVNTVIGKSANEIFVKVARLMLNTGKEVSPRGLLTRELSNVWLRLEEPENWLVTLPERGIDMAYLEGEMAWYKSGSLKVDGIVKHSKFWETLADAEGNVNSNYGYLVFLQGTHDGKNQYDWCLEKIKQDPETRQAVINYNQPEHKYPGNKDFVCTLTQSFRQRDGVIDTTVHMRSNDLIYGLTYDIAWFVFVLKRLCDDTGYSMGCYNHFAESLHVYERHFDMLKKIAGASLGEKG